MDKSIKKKINILLIEDDEIDIQSVCRAIKKTDVSIQLNVVRNGLEALIHLSNLAAEKKMKRMPNLIIMDINMPKMNGVEFLQKLRTSPKLNSAKIMVLTNSNQINDRMIFSNLKVDSYITKPINIEILINYFKNVGMLQS